MKEALSGNLVGFFLTAVGVFVITLGAHWHMAELTTLGTATLIPSALLAFKIERGHGGNPDAGKLAGARAREDEAMKGFLDKLKAAVVSMWHKAPAVAVWIASAINNLVPLIEQLDVIADPAEAALINPILDKVKVGLAALKVVVQNAGGAHANATAIVSSVASNLDALLNAAEIKNPQTKQKIADVVSVVKAELTTIGAVLPGA